jgi:hypothetical protein
MTQPALRAKSGSRGKIQLRWRQGRNASWPSQRQSVVPLILATMPLAIASCRSSATDQRAKGRSRRDGSSQASALIATTTLGGKAGWPPAAWSVVETRQPLKTEPLTPLAGDLAWQAKLSCYPIVAEPPAREQYDLRPHDIAIWQRILFAANLQLDLLVFGEPDYERALPRHDISSHPRRTLSCRHESPQEYVTGFMKRSTY